MKLNLEAVGIITSEWITEILRQNDILKKGDVIAVVKEPLSDASFEAPKIIRIRLSYSQNAVGDMPKTMIFKTAKREKEKIFYDELAQEMTDPAITHCFYANVDQNRERAIFLLEDLGDTHQQTRWPIAPSFDTCQGAMDCIAKFHAFWWEHPRLDGDLRDKLTFGNYWQDRINFAIEELPDFFDFMGERISAKRRKIYEEVLSSPNTFWKPQQSKHALTLIHGDAHFWNFLYPRTETDRIRVFDWNSWDIGKGTDDLAYMIGLHWYPERRDRFEIPLLKHYHEALLKHGVEHYSWEDCWDDYRHSAILNLFIPVWQWAKEISQIVWWSHWERSFLTFADLDCGALL